MPDYSHKGHYFILEPRIEVRKLARKLLNGQSFLDIGAGYGNNTRYLLNKGHKVTALEPFESALRELKKLETNYSGLKVIGGSVDSYKPTKQFDAVVCCVVLHFVNTDEEAVRNINQIKAWTKPGGYNLITSYMGGQDLSEDYTFLLEHNQLLDLYEGWEIVWYEESHARRVGTIGNVKDLLRLMSGNKGYKAARILARKPN